MDWGNPEEMADLACKSALGFLEEEIAWQK